MPNLMLTNYCNYHCAYCFGVDMMAPKQPAQRMSRDTFKGIVEWLKKRPFDNIVHLMGGEPTLNPDFEWMVDYLLENDLYVTVFSNMATDQAPVYAEKLSCLPVRWVANVNNPANWTAHQRENIMKALKAAGKNAALTFNIIPDEPNELWALDLIKECGLSPEVKVGFVLPTLTNSNLALPEEKYSEVAQRVVDLVKAGEDIGLHVGYECGVPYCAFNDEQSGYLWRHNSYPNSGCMSRMDITPDGYMIYCLPLATAHKRHYTEFDNYQECREWFEAQYAPYRLLGAKIECAECMLNNPEKCRAGCVAKNMIGANNVKF